MESSKKIFKISFISLLDDVTESLELPNPIYGPVGDSSNHAFVLIRMPTGSQASYFEGRKRKTLVDSKEDAAEKAIAHLAKKHRLQIEDVNLESKKKYKGCSEFFLALRAGLGDLELADVRLQSKLHKKRALAYPMRSVSINYIELLADIVSEYKIRVTPTETRKLESGGFMSCLSIECPEAECRVEWMIGDACDTYDASEKSVAKKTILYLQPIYKFEVKDSNYYGSYFAEARCAIERENYLNARDKAIRVADDSDPQQHVIEDGCRTPTEPHTQIPSSSIAPPPPKKPKSIPITSPLMNKAIQIDAELASIFKPT